MTRRRVQTAPINLEPRAKRVPPVIVASAGGRPLSGGGLVLLWSSRAWTTRDTWIGTLVIPGGLATSAITGLIATGAPTKRICSGIAGGVQHRTNAAGPSTASNILGVAVFALLVLAPIATSVYLARRAAYAITQQSNDALQEQPGRMCHRHIATLTHSGKNARGGSTTRR